MWVVTRWFERILALSGRFLPFVHCGGTVGPNAVFILSMIDSGISIIHVTRVYLFFVLFFLLEADIRPDFL